jgi:hypothetical protein
LPLAPGATAGVIKPKLLDKAWSTDGWKMARAFWRAHCVQMFHATDFCRQRFTIAADFLRRFGWNALARANRGKSE